MGCDGGTIPRRDELVRVKKKPEQKDKEAELAYRWRHCALTQQPLQEPIVMCGLGRLYSKQSIIEYLLEKEKNPIDSVKHIKSLKDVKNLTLTKNPNYNVDDNKTEGLIDVRSAPYICKLIGLEMTGKFRFVALWSCGCVFSERALKEIKTKSCSLCQEPYTDADIVILNGIDADIELMITKMEARRKAVKKDKSAKKLLNSKSAVTSTITSAELTTAPTTETPLATSTSAIKEKPAETVVNGKSHPISSKLMNGNTSKTIKTTIKRESTSELLTDPAMKKLKDGNFSVAKDPKASDVYKSIFTSHKSEQEQTRAHWVTYNPFYN